MATERPVRVHLLPDLVREEDLAGSISVVIDVLRATTTAVYALAAGCTDIRPCLEVEEARELANQMRAGRVVLAGERHGLPPAGFDAGNSPREFTPSLCRNSTVVLTTTNGTRAIHRAAAASRVLLAGFVNFSAVCEQLKHDQRPVHLICAGTDGEAALEDTLLAGAFVDFLCDTCEVSLNDSARLAWDCYEHHGRVLLGALEISRGGCHLKKLGLEEDIRIAAQIDRFHLIPELNRDPLRIEIGAVGIVNSHWTK
ncbi:MAG: putative 2-phosphosulfolactate phosphatase [Gemmatales bacterium]|nr:MAG: putative 2-phosphosulfolactate phosphatase [Gemmatales bacterium]